MNEEIDESEYFHQDFTTASEWEVFIARIEEIIAQWKKDDLDTETPVKLNIWETKTEQLSYVDFDFNLSLHRRKVNVTDDVKKNPFDSYYDFELFDPECISDHSMLAVWYGINEFVVLSPAGSVGLTSESKIKMLLSSLYIVAGNTKCEIPLFVQIREKWQQCYLGVYESSGIRTNLEMVHLKYGPRLCQYLSGLLEMFRSKIVSSTMNTTILVSMQSTYVLNDFGHYIWKQDYLNCDTDNFDNVMMKILPFGTTVDPISAVELKVTWEKLGHGEVRDSESYSTFNPLDSSKWSLLCRPAEQALCLLGESLTEFLNILNNSSTIHDVLGDFVPATSIDTNPLDVLTEPKVPIISMLSRAARNSLTSNKRGSTTPLAEEYLVKMLYFLFPDAEEGSNNLYQISNLQNSVISKDDGFNLDHECRGLKTCPADSLIWRLSTVLAHSLQSFGGIKAFAHLWFEFVQEMRYRWEKSINILGVLPGSPDLRTNLLHQKLQMLNCCIERKKVRESTSGVIVSTESASSEEDDEFFDCADKVTNEEPTRRKVKHSLWNQPVGRLGKFNDLKLIKTGDPLYIPLTQEPVPKSEDQLEEDTDVLLKLGSDAQASELRAKMMSASLLSDMESFKAANPGSILEDFIRWYSPRDWIETDELDDWGQCKGFLSSRMLIEDNFWKQTWDSAQPVPAHRQKRLFDDTREAEKVLHYLDSRTISQICELIAPVLCHNAIYKLVEEADSVQAELADAEDRLRPIIKIAEKLTRDTKLSAARLDTFIQEVIALELRIAQINSLLYKFNPAGSPDRILSEVVGNLSAGREATVDGQSESKLGKRLTTLFAEALRNANMILPDLQQQENEQTDAPSSQRLKMSFPQPTVREVVLRVAVPRSAPYSKECPQFLRAILAKHEFRLIGAFSEDIMLF